MAVVVSTNSRRPDTPVETRFATPTSTLHVWLAALGLEQYAAVFSENDIDLEVLSERSEKDLAELGVSLGHRKKILKAFARQIEARADLAQLPVIGSVIIVISPEVESGLGRFAFLSPTLTARLAFKWAHKFGRDPSTVEAARLYAHAGAIDSTFERGGVERDALRQQLGTGQRFRVAPGDRFEAARPVDQAPVARGSLPFA